MHERWHKRGPVQITVPSLAASFRQEQAIVARRPVQGQESLIRLRLRAEGIGSTYFQAFQSLIEMPLERFCLAETDQSTERTFAVRCSGVDQDAGHSLTDSEAAE